MDIKKKLRTALTEELTTNKKPIDIKKLEAYSQAIEVICNGEYGVTYFNKEENKIWLMLGDSCPLDSEDIIWYMRDAIKSSWQVDDDEIDIEIGDECHPSGEGWETFNGKKWEKYEND